MNLKDELLGSLEKEPKYLYHASQNKEVEEFEPKKRGVRDPSEGPVIFASQDKAYTSMFIVKCDNAWTIKGQRDNDYFIAIADREKFEEADKGGAIYTLNSKGFITEPEQEGLRSKEWVSRKNVRPVSKEIYNSGLEAMKSSGVKVFFISYDLLNEINRMFDEGRGEDATKLLFKQSIY